MIKKFTKVIFLGDREEHSDELIGGIPFSVGEKINLHKDNQVIECKVVEKIVDCYLNDENQKIDIVYKVKKI